MPLFLVENSAMQNDWVLFIHDKLVQTTAVASKEDLTWNFVQDVARHTAPRCRRMIHWDDLPVPLAHTCILMAASSFFLSSSLCAIAADCTFSQCLRAISNFSFFRRATLIEWNSTASHLCRSSTPSTARVVFFHGVRKTSAAMSFHSRPQVAVFESVLSAIICSYV